MVPVREAPSRHRIQIAGLGRKQRSTQRCNHKSESYLWSQQGGAQA